MVHVDHFHPLPIRDGVTGVVRRPALCTSHAWSLLFGSGATSSEVGWLGLEEEYRLILTIDRVIYMKLIIRGTSNCATSRARQINGNDVGSSLSYASNLQITICGRSVTPVILFRSCRYHYFLMPSFVGA
jgi:hypothetical protein